MTPEDLIFVAAGDVRRALVEPGDIRAEIEYQNDINGMLSRMDDTATLEPIVGTSGTSTPSVTSEGATPSATRGLRIIQGGVASGRAPAQPPPFRAPLARTG